MTVKEFINILLDLPMASRVKFSIDDDDRGIVIKSSGDTDVQASDPYDGWGGFSDEVTIYITGCYEDSEDDSLK